jgi:hypothetical protein
VIADVKWGLWLIEAVFAKAGQGRCQGLQTFFLRKRRTLSRLICSMPVHDGRLA